MMTLQQALQLGQQQLQSLDTARLDSELLLAQVLGQPRSYLYAWPERECSPAQEQHYRELLQRRADGEPLAYISGTQEFWSLALAVRPGVLVPRPETELLVETALGLALPADAEVADLGSGSGAIALALASERPGWQVTAVDNSPSALQCSQRNVDGLGLRNVTVLRSDWFEQLKGRQFDLICSNPPYIEASDPHLRGDGLRYEPHEALVSGETGLDDLQRIVAQARPHLRPGAFLLLEHGHDQAAPVRALFERYAYCDIGLCQDLAGQDRLSMARSGR